MAIDIEEYMHRAENGDTECQNALGQMFSEGMHGLEKDISKAVYWYLRAAEGGNPFAQFNLGFLYDFAEGIENDKKLAAEYYEKAASAGVTRAKFRLGYLYDIGEGVAQDLARASSLYLEAALDGDGDAQYNLGGMYYQGRGVEQDLVSAYIWESIANENQIGGATRAVEVLEAKLSEQELVKAKEQIEELRQRQNVFNSNT